MKIVIDIDEITYKLLCHSLRNGVLNTWEEIIAKGKLLPKHNRLIDAEETKKKIEKFWTEQKGFSLVDVMNVIDLETETYARSD